MAKIYSAPEEIVQPEMDFSDLVKYRRDEQAYIESLSDWVKKRNPNGECIGEIVNFPVADGHASYMVASLKPVELIHIPLGDAWNFQYANRLTAKDVREKISNAKRLAELFPARH